MEEQKKNEPKMAGLLFGMFRRYQLETEKESSSGNLHCWTDGVYIPRRVERLSWISQKQRQMAT